MKLLAVIDHPGEPAAGINSYTEIVTVTVEWDPGGEPGEFLNHIRECLAEWFDGAKIEIKEATS